LISDRDKIFSFLVTDNEIIFFVTMIRARQLFVGAAHRLSQSYRSTMPSCRSLSTERVTKVYRWTDAETWGFASAAAGWTMSLAAIYDSLNTGPEVISLSMTGVLILYSSLFCRWAYVVRPQNLFLAACHITNIAAQLNQGRRAIEYQLANGQDQRIRDLAQQAGAVGVILGGSIVAGPHVRVACLPIPL
jgi:hypothetical protein